MSIETRTIISPAAAIARRAAFGPAITTTFERLESRQLMSAVAFADHALTIDGTGRADDIRVMLSDDGSQVWARVNGKRSATFVAADVWTLNINAFDGDNDVRLDARIRSTTNVETGSGDDTVVTGAGNDGIRTGGGRDSISSGAGADVIESGSGDDRIDAGDGDDFVSAGRGDDAIDLGAGNDQAYGRRGDDVIHGKPTDLIDAGGGANRVTRDGDIAPAPQVRRLSLVNADTGAVIGGYESLWTSQTLDLATLPGHVSIVADVDRGARSVRFQLSDGSLDRVENGTTFAMTQGSWGHLAPWTPRVGTVTLNVTGYTQDDAAGLAGDTTSMQFTIARSGGTPTPAPAPPPSPAPAPTPTPAPTRDPAAPSIRIVALQATVIAGQAYHAQATQTVIPGYQVEDARFNWDFGDANGRFNALPGFNVAHVYETPGTYSVRLTVTAPGGHATTETTTVNVVASNYRTIYVAANGNDANDGSDEGRAVRSLPRALELAGDDTRILLNRGDTFTLTSQQSLNKNNLVLSSYGNGSNPTLLWTGGRGGATSMVTIPNATHDVLIRGLTFNTIFNTDTEQSGVPHAILNGGRNVTVRDNTFLNVGYAINNNLLPVGLLAVDNKAPLETGIRGYFCWTQGSDIVVVGNEVANSTREHIVRLGGADRVNVSYNKFANLDRTAQGDFRDTAKGTIVIQKGSYGYVAHNEVRGPLGVGPLGGADGLNDKGARFVHAAFEDNVSFGGTFFFQHGAEHVTVRDNTFYKDGGIAIDMFAYNAEYGRGVVDAVIDHNIGINYGTQGVFAQFDGAADGTTLTNNVYVAPYLLPGSFGTAAVYVNENDLSSFRRISGNVWPAAGRGSTFARGGMVFLGTSYTTDNHRRPAEWNALDKVGDDTFEDVTLDGFTANRTTSMLRAA